MKDMSSDALLFGLLFVVATAVIIPAFVWKRRKAAYRLAVWISVVLALLSLIPLVVILFSMQSSREAGFALPFALVLPVPFVVALLVLWGFGRRKMSRENET